MKRDRDMARAMLLHAAPGMVLAPKVLAGVLGVNPSTVTRWIRRYPQCGRRLGRTTAVSVDGVLDMLLAREMASAFGEHAHRITNRHPPRRVTQEACDAP